jgi:hypothetical protein
MQPNLSKVDFTLDAHDNFFIHVWPDMTGMMAIIDENISSPCGGAFHQTTWNGNIKCNNPTALEPDCGR